MKKILLLTIIIFLNACASIKPINRSTVKNNPTGVELEIDADKKPSTPEEIPPTIIKEETIRIGDNGGSIYSQGNDSQNIEEKGEARKIRIGLTFGPGLNRAITFVEILKEFEKQNLKINVISGNEMGAVVAALYANGNTPEMIEWMFFKYFKEHKNTKIYSKEWIEEIDEFFLSKLRNSKIEDSKIKYYITLFDHKTSKVYYFDKGNIHDLLLLNLRLKENPMKYKDGPEYSGAFETEAFNAKLASGVGSDFNIAIDVLVNKISLGEKNHFLSQALLSASTRYQNEKRKYDFILNLPVSEMPLDLTSDTTVYVDKTHEYLKKQMSSLRKKMQAKVDFLNTKNLIKDQQ